MRQGGVGATRRRVAAAGEGEGQGGALEEEEEEEVEGVAETVPPPEEATRGGAAPAGNPKLTRCRHCGPWR